MAAEKGYPFVGRVRNGVMEEDPPWDLNPSVGQPSSLSPSAMREFLTTRLGKEKRLMTMWFESSLGHMV